MISVMGLVPCLKSRLVIALNVPCSPKNAGTACIIEGVCLLRLSLFASTFASDRIDLLWVFPAREIVVGVITVPFLNSSVRMDLPPKDAIGSNVGSKKPFQYTRTSVSDAYINFSTGYLISFSIFARISALKVCAVFTLASVIASPGHPVTYPEPEWLRADVKFENLICLGIRQFGNASNTRRGLHQRKA